MFSRSSGFDLTSLLSGQSLTGANSLLGTSSTSTLGASQDTSGLFQMLLAQMLVKLLDRLETQGAASTAALFVSGLGLSLRRGHLS